MTAPSLAELRRIAEAARDAKLRLSAACQQVWKGDYLSARAAVEITRATLAVQEDAILALFARVERAEAALRGIAGFANECTWHRSTRHIAEHLSDAIRDYFDGAPRDD